MRKLQPKLIAKDPRKKLSEKRQGKKYERVPFSRKYNINQKSL